MKKILMLAVCASISAFGTSLMDGEQNEANRRDGQRSNTDFRQWDLGGGLTMSVRAFQLNGSFSGANTTQFGENNFSEIAGVATIGMGVCGGTESCSANQWQVDNAAPGGRDFVLFTFSAPVNLSSFTIVQTSTSELDSDWSYFISSSAITTTAGLNTATSNGTSNIFNVNGVGGDGNDGMLEDFETSVRTIASATNVRSILIGAGQITTSCTNNINNCDYFKLTDMTVISTVPEPSSMVLLGGGLIGLSVVARKRRKKS